MGNDIEEIIGSLGLEWQSQIDIATQAITQAMLEALPEKVDESSWERSIPKRQYNKGFNQAISEMESAIKKMGSE